jgi:hypothetical protein
MSLKLKFFIAFVVVLAALQLLPLKCDNPPYNKDEEIKAPKEVMTLFRRACYDCHSNETKWPWYSHVAPMSIFVVKHVHDGRAWLNFSVWEKYNEKKKKELKNKIFRSVAMAMPLGMYLKVHKEAVLSEDEKDIIRRWASNGTMQIEPLR